MRFIVWLFRAFIFFTLFAFALNNQQDAVVHWFFGTQWQAPMVIVVLAAFALGCALGVLAQGFVDFGLCRGTPQAVLESGDYKRFYMHRTGHWLGLDVHDAGEHRRGDHRTPAGPRHQAARRAPGRTGA